MIEAVKAVRRRPHDLQLKHLDINVGDHLLFPNESGNDGNEFWEFRGLTSDGTLSLVSDRTGRRKILTEHTFNQMRGSGEAIRFTSDAPGAKAASEYDIHPGLTADPLVKLPQVIADSLEAKRRLVMRRRIVRQFTILFDEAPEWVSKGELGLQRFIRTNSHNVNHFGLEWDPSASNLREAINNCGIPGNRPLTAFLRPGPNASGGGRWHHLVLELRSEMVALYYSSPKIRICDAIDRFKNDFATRRSKHEAPGHRIKCPSDSALRNWINEAASPENVTCKYSRRVARAKLRGTDTPSLAAKRILQYVLIDHTPLDVWAKVLDADGRTVLVARPYLTLALDLFSRTVIGAIISFEPPSLNSVMACIRQIVRPKAWLLEKYGELNGATDVWGRPRWIVVDNGLEFVSPSFQSSLEAAGIDVIWAPVKNPEYKIFVERMFRTLNELIWHRMPGAIPMAARELKKLELEVDPPDEAKFTVEDLSDIFWEAIATVYHLEVHKGIDMAPARAWTAGKKRYGRPMVDDVRVLDKLFGRVTTATLTVKGIAVDSMRFSDQRKVTGLLTRLLPRAAKRKQGKGVLSSGKVNVTITIYAWTADHIGVWDPIMHQVIDLPNVHPRFSKGQSWTDAAACKAFADRENLAFHSEEQRCAARVALATRLAGNPRHLAPTEKKVALRAAATPREAELRGVVQTIAPASHDGMQDFGVPVGVAAKEIKGSRKPAKAPRRGGEQASKRAAEARKARKAPMQRDERKIEKAQLYQSEVLAPTTKRELTEGDRDRAVALLDELEKDLDWRY